MSYTVYSSCPERTCTLIILIQSLSRIHKASTFIQKYIQKLISMVSIKPRNTRRRHIFLSLNFKISDLRSNITLVNNSFLSNSYNQTTHIICIKYNLKHHNSYKNIYETLSANHKVYSSCPDRTNPSNYNTHVVCIMYK